MAQAAMVLAWSGMEGDISLGARFVWAATLLLGIAAITRNHIHGFARSPRPAPLAAAAGELRALFLYTGLAWGLGAFLVWPATALSAFIIAAPVLAAALILRCERTVIAFAAPASALAAIALWWRGQPLLAVALAAVSIAGVSMLHCAIHRRLLQR
jgi:hypothetical protein